MILVAHVNESRHTCELRHVTYMNESRHTCELSRVTHVNESRISDLIKGIRFGHITHSHRVTLAPVQESCNTCSYIEFARTGGSIGV